MSVATCPTCRRSFDRKGTRARFCGIGCQRAAYRATHRVNQANYRARVAVMN